jgi:hypothetical protein
MSRKQKPTAPRKTAHRGRRIPQFIAEFEEAVLLREIAGKSIEESLRDAVFFNNLRDKDLRWLVNTCCPTSRMFTWREKLFVVWLKAGKNSTEAAREARYAKPKQEGTRAIRRIAVKAMAWQAARTEAQN